MEPPATQILPLTPDMSEDEARRRLQINALASHQRSMGRGDELVQILQRTIGQMERTHNRIQYMSTILFVAGIGVLIAGVAGVLTGNDDVWPALLGGAGGIGALAAVFWTAPLDKVSASVNDLVKLEAAFLGYIRVIGEIDSGFQMQYLSIVQSSNGGPGAATLSQAIRDTTAQMKDMMITTVELIDERVSSPAALGARLDELKERVGELEGSSPGG
jgi:hypothetical protein